MYQWNQVNAFQLQWRYTSNASDETLASLKSTASTGDKVVFRETGFYVNSWREIFRFSLSFPHMSENWSSKGNLPQWNIRGCYSAIAKNVIPVFLLSSLSKQTYSENGVLWIMNKIMLNSLLWLARLWKNLSSEFMREFEALKRIMKNSDGNMRVKNIARSSSLFLSYHGKQDCYLFSKMQHLPSSNHLGFLFSFYFFDK